MAVEFDSIKIKDQLGRPEDMGITIIRKQDTLIVEQNSTIIKKDTIGNSWIAGSSSNGLVGTNTATQRGGQQVVGASGRVITLQRVINPNNTFREHFRLTTFQGSPCTADWNTTLYRLRMHTSNVHTTVYNTVATTLELFYNSQTITSATLTCNETKWNDTDEVHYFLSADGGNNWEEVTRGTAHTFTNQGQDLRAKIVFFGQGGADTYIEDLQIGYEVSS